MAKKPGKKAAPAAPAKPVPEKPAAPAATASTKEGMLKLKLPKEVYDALYKEYGALCDCYMSINETGLVEILIDDPLADRTYAKFGIDFPKVLGVVLPVIGGALVSRFGGSKGSWFGGFGEKAKKLVTGK